MKKSLAFLFFLPFCLFSQETYQYVIVNSKFNFVKKTDGYSTSSLAKFLFQKKGYKVFLDNEELPDVLAINKCNALFVDVKDESGFLTTKTFIEIKDCKGRVLKKSSIGKSKLKDRKRAYYQSIKEAFKTLDYSKISIPAIANVSTKKAAKEIKKPKKIMDKTEVSEDVLEVNAFKVGDDYYLFDKDKKLHFKMTPTKSKDIFILIEQKGTVVKTGNYWLVTINNNQESQSKKLFIHF